MSDLAVSVRRSIIINENSGKCPLRNVKSFTVIEDISLSEWLKSQYLGGNYPQIIDQHATVEAGGDVRFIIQYYVLDENEHNISCESSLEMYLIHHDVLKC